MKRAIRKFGLSLVPAMAFAALFSACGDDSGSNSSRGEDPSPEVAELELANGKAVVCDDDMEGVVAITADDGYRKCVDGEWIKIKKLEAMKADKIIGQLDDDDDDISDTDPESSSSQKQSSSSKKPSILDEDDDDNDGDDDDVISSSSSVIPNSSNSVILSSSSVIPSEVEGSSSSKGGSSVLYECPDGTVVANLENCKPPSSSSSDTPNTSASETPGTSSGVIPGTDPESSSDEAVDLSYATKCPAGHTCTYAPTEYLNPKVTYGELLDERDYQMYKTVEICDKNDENCQTWMAQNLNYAYTGVKYNYDGYTSDSTSWCYDDDPSNCATYGRLYTWAAAVDSVAIYKNYGEECGYGKSCTRFSATALATAPVRGVCPSGWHLPSGADWQMLFENVGGTGTAGSVLKSASGWSRGNGTNSFGFAVLPAGNRYGDGSFYDEGNYADFWSSTEESSGNAVHWNFYYNNGSVNGSWDYENGGFSVRCLKDSPDQGGEASNSSSSESSSSDTPNTSASETPDTDPESPSEVKDDGYYKTNCPAGLDCKYATTTDYLNSTKTYGEVLDTRDGQVYKTVTIGIQTWMAENLNYDPGNVSSMGSYAWSGCYGNESSNCTKYGRLYTWGVAMDDASCAYGKACNASLNPSTPVRGVCPQGWHLPSHYEFEELINFIDPDFGYNHTDDASSSKAGLYLKSQSGWNSSVNGSDAYGFSALPGGYRDDNGGFYYEGSNAFFWSSGEYGSDDAFGLYLYYYDDFASLFWNYKNYARSVRCLKD